MVKQTQRFEQMQQIPMCSCVRTKPRLSGSSRCCQIIEDLPVSSLHFGKGLLAAIASPQ